MAKSFLSVMQFFFYSTLLTTALFLFTSSKNFSTNGLFSSLFAQVIVAEEAHIKVPKTLSEIPCKAISIPMRDGYLLPANLYLPDSDSVKKFPTVLVRHPLGKERIDPLWIEYIEAGYALVVQSTRSCCDTSGKLVPYVTDGWSDDHQPADGYDTVQWIASSDFCDGQVSTIGSSATGITQFLLAPSSPPNLRCQSIEMAPPSMYQYAVYPGGGFRKEQVEGWLQVHKRDQSVVDWLHSKSRYDSFWRRFNELDFVDRVRVPQLHIGGWYDIFLQGTIDSYVAGHELSQPEVRNQHRLIIGPWGHRWRYSGKLAETALTSEQKTPPYDITTKNWLDFHVKGSKNIVANSPKIQYYVMGSVDGKETKGDIWRTTEEWPPYNSVNKKFFLDECRSLIQEEGSKGNQLNSHYKIFFNGKNPVPTIGGRNLFLPDGPRDLQSLQKRDDVLFFSTAQLKEDLEVTGRLWAHLHVSGIFKERDICLRLVDISEDGSAHIIAEGVTRVAPKLSDNGKMQMVQSDPRLVIVDLWSTSKVFAKGHKVGLVVSATNFPAYEISGGEEEENEIAFTLHSTKRHQSFLFLPIMP